MAKRKTDDLKPSERLSASTSEKPAGSKSVPGHLAEQGKGEIKNTLDGKQLETISTSSMIEKPDAILIEELEKNDRVTYVPASKTIDFGDGNEITPEEFYRGWRTTKPPHGVDKCCQLVFDDFLARQVEQRIRRDFAGQLPVYVRGANINIDDTFEAADLLSTTGASLRSPDVKEVLQYGHERGAQKGNHPIRNTIFEGGEDDRIDDRSVQWAYEAPRDVRKRLSNEHKQKIFPAFFVYGSGMNRLDKIYVLDNVKEPDSETA